MSNYYRKSVAALVLLAVCLFGCEMEQEVPIPEHEPKLTLRLALTNAEPDSLHYWSGQFNQLFIGKSQSILRSDYYLEGVPNAIVTLHDETEQVVERYQHTGKYVHEYFSSQPSLGYYEAINGYVPSPGKRYTMRAAAPGYQSIEAKVQLPAITPIVEATVSDLATAPFGILFLEGNLRVTFQDDPTVQNYYRVVAYPADSTGARLGYNQLRPLVERSGPELGVNKESLWLGAIISDELYKSNQITLTNRFSMPAFDGRYLIETGKKRLTHFVEVQVQQLTKDEYLYYKTIDAQWSNDGNPFAEYTQVHSNVQHGFGVLGGVTISKQLIPVR